MMEDVVDSECLVLKASKGDQSTGAAAAAVAVCAVCSKVIDQCECGPRLQSRTFEELGT